MFSNQPNDSTYQESPFLNICCVRIFWRTYKWSPSSKDHVWRLLQKIALKSPTEYKGKCCLTLFTQRTLLGVFVSSFSLWTCAQKFIIGKAMRLRLLLGSQTIYHLTPVLYHSSVFPFYLKRISFLHKEPSRTLKYFNLSLSDYTDSFFSLPVFALLSPLL